MKKHHVNLLVGGLVGALTGLVLISVDQDNGQYQAALIAQNGTVTTTPATPVEPAKNYSQPQSELDNAKQNLKNTRQNYDNRSNELKTNFRNTKADLTALSNKMGEWKACIDTAEASVNAGDYNSANNKISECNDISRDYIDDGFRQAYAKSGLYNDIDNIKNSERELKDMERGLKETKKNAERAKITIDTAKLDGFYTKMQAEIAKLKELSAQASTTTDPETLSQDIRDVSNEFNYTKQDYYDYSNEVNQTVNNASNLENSKRNLKDKQRVEKDMEREIKRLSKNLSQEELQNLNQELETLKSIRTQIETAISTGDSETANSLDRDFWDANTDINDLLNQAREAEQKVGQNKDAARIIKEKTRQLKDMERECKRNKCESSEAGDVLQQLRDLLAQMQEAANSGDMETFWDLNSQFDESNRTFWDLNQQKSQQKDITRWLKDTIREWNDKERMINQFRKDAKRRDANVPIGDVEKLQDVYEQGIAVIQAAKEALAGRDSETANDQLQNLNDIRMQFDEIVNGFNKGRETQYAQSEMNSVSRDLDDAELQINDKLETGEITQEDASKCLGLVAQGRDLLDQWRKVVEGGKIGEFEGDQKQVEIGFKKLESQFMKNCGDIVDMGEDRPNVQGFTEAYVGEQFRGTAEDVFSRINIDEIANKLIEKLMSDANISNLFNSILEKVSQKYEEQIAKTMEAISYMAESVQQQILSYKEGILEQLDAAGQKYNDDIKNQIVGYNWVADTAEELDGKIQQGASITPQYLNSLKQRDLDYKFANRIIPAIDVPDNEWYFGYVTDAYNRHIVSGKDERRFDPGANVTVAEILKMVLNAVGSGESDEAPELAIAQNHWARGYVAQAENLGLSILDGLKSLDRPATRAEVVKLILQAAVIEQEDGGSSFKDVSGPDAGYIEKAKNLGIVSGDEGKGTFRPNASINRAEAAKIIGNVVKLGRSGN